MPVDQKDLYEYLGVEGEKLEDFRENFEKKFINRNLIKDDKELWSSLTGNIFGSVKTAFVSNLKKAGVEIDKDEIKELKAEKIIELGVSKLSEKYQSELNDLKTNSGKSNDEAFKTLQEKFTKVESERNDLKNLLSETKENFNKAQESWNSEKKTIKLSTKTDDLYKGMKWKTGATELEKEGFFAVFNKKYKPDLDDQDSLFLTDLSGHRIPNPKKNGEFKSPFEILQEEAVAKGVWETNPIAERGKVQPPIHHTNGAPNRIESPVLSPGGRARVIAERNHIQRG